MNLEEFISSIAPENNVYICVKDISDITQKSPFQIPTKRRMLSCEFCSAAKDVPGGLVTCINEAEYKTAHAKATKKTFVQKCPFGVISIVHPVVVNDKVLCVLYITSLITDSTTTASDIKITCAKLKGKPEGVLNQLHTLQHTRSLERYFKLAHAIDAYIKLLLQQTGTVAPLLQFHHAVQEVIAEMQLSYHKDISLQSCASTLGMNPKYLGRLFQQQTGKNFHAYLNGIRLRHAKDLLFGTHVPVIEIALSCGYNTVTYFNRIFKQNEGISPSEFRKIHNPKKPKA